MQVNWNLFGTIFLIFQVTTSRYWQTEIWGFSLILAIMRNFGSRRNIFPKHVKEYLSVKALNKTILEKGRRVII